MDNFENDMIGAELSDFCGEVIRPFRDGYLFTHTERPDRVVLVTPDEHGYLTCCTTYGGSVAEHYRRGEWQWERPAA